MNLIGLMCWYDEPVDLLAKCIKGLHDAGVSHIVAVDGAYALYPDAQPASNPNQQGAIVTACRTLGMDCTLHVPSNPWQGNETEKRTFLFELGYMVAEPEDWFWVQDADQIVTAAPDDLKERLAATDAPSAEVEFTDAVAERMNHPTWPAQIAVRSMFRAQRITVGPAHNIYRGEDGSLLWGWLKDVEAEPTLDLTDCVKVDHLPHKRPVERLQRKLQFYAERDESGIERGECLECGDRAVRLVAHGWSMSDELGAPVSLWNEYCERHARKFEARARYELRNLGFDPDRPLPGHRAVENRNGRIPEAVA